MSRLMRPTYTSSWCEASSGVGNLLLALSLIKETPFAFDSNSTACKQAWVSHDHEWCLYTSSYYKTLKVMLNLQGRFNSTTGSVSSVRGLELCGACTCRPNCNIICQDRAHICSHTLLVFQQQIIQNAMLRPFQLIACQKSGLANISKRASHHAPTQTSKDVQHERVVSTGMNPAYLFLWYIMVKIKVNAPSMHTRKYMICTFQDSSHYMCQPGVPLLPIHCDQTQDLCSQHAPAWWALVYMWRSHWRHLCSRSSLSPWPSSSLLHCSHSLSWDCYD